MQRLRDYIPPDALLWGGSLCERCFIRRAITDSRLTNNHLAVKRCSLASACERGGRRVAVSAISGRLLCGDRLSLLQQLAWRSGTQSTQRALRVPLSSRRLAALPPAAVRWQSYALAVIH